jgi:hypothetical protein
MADQQAALLGRSKKAFMETKMSVQTLATTRGIREQTGFAAPALPMLVYRINRAFLTQIFVVPAHLINKHRKTLVAQFLAALSESRRGEAARVINRYRHLIDDEQRD